MKRHGLERLSSAIARHSQENESTGSLIEELHLSCFTASTSLTSLVYEPCICVVAQGSKEVVLAGESFHLDPAQFMLVSVDLPVDARVLEASSKEPYLGLRLALDPKVVGEMLASVSEVPTKQNVERGLAVTPVESPLFDAITRLVELLDTPEDIPSLAPLTIREIAHRVLKGPQGLRLRQMLLAGAPAYRVAQAIRWLRENFTAPLKIDTLAEQVGLGTSTFHLHFKNVTAMTPLQYQKRMRLQEARSLMLGEQLDAAEAAFRVGYESASQFSREYRRMFGAPPRQDIEALLSTES